MEFTCLPHVRDTDPPDRCKGHNCGGKGDRGRDLLLKRLKIHPLEWIPILPFRDSGRIGCRQGSRRKRNSRAKVPTTDERIRTALVYHHAQSVGSGDSNRPSIRNTAGIPRSGRPAPIVERGEPIPLPGCVTVDVKEDDLNGSAPPREEMTTFWAGNDDLPGRGDGRSVGGTS